MKKIFTLIIALVISNNVTNAQLLHDNGPLVDSPGAGFGGADASTLHDGIINYGFNQNLVAGFMVADDFTVPAGGWTIDSLVFFGYQTTSTTTSTFTSLRYMIYDGDPSSGGNIIYGDTVNDRLINTYWSGIYRVNSTTLTDVNRPVMRNVCDAPALTLPAGNYWIAWQASGSLASGPWNPPISILGQINTGNAVQFVAANAAWQAVKDTNVTAGTGSGGLQGFPFEIYGTVGTGINSNNQNLNLLNIYPIPANETLNLNLQSKTNSVVEIVIVDITGKEVLIQNQQVNAGNNKLILDLKIAKGVYSLKIKTGETILVRKFVKE